MYNIKTDNSGQASTELILLLAGLIMIVLFSLVLYKNYIMDFSREIENNELDNLLDKIDNISTKIS